MVECPLSAQSGHTKLHCTCPLLGVKRTCLFALQMSAYDPKRTWVHPLSFGAGLMVLDTPHKVITETAYQASVAESSVALPPE